MVPPLYITYNPNAAAMYTQSAPRRPSIVRCLSRSIMSSVVTKKRQWKIAQVAKIISGERGMHSILNYLG